MNKRLNITLPEQTVPLMDRVAGKGQRSSLIDRAVRRYVKEETRANLRKQLTESYQANAAINLQLAEEWFALEDRGMATRRSIAHAAARVYLAAERLAGSDHQRQSSPFCAGGT